MQCYSLKGPNISHYKSNLTLYFLPENNACDNIHTNIFESNTNQSRILYFELILNYLKLLVDILYTVASDLNYKSRNAFEFLRQQ